MAKYEQHVFEAASRCMKRRQKNEAILKRNAEVHRDMYGPVGIPRSVLRGGPLGAYQTEDVQILAVANSLESELSIHGRNWQ